MFGMGPIGDGLGLMHPVTSYVDELVIAVTSCREMIPTPRSTRSACKTPTTSWPRPPRAGRPHRRAVVLAAHSCQRCTGRVAWAISGTERRRPVAILTAFTTDRGGVPAPPTSTPR